MLIKFRPGKQMYNVYFWKNTNTLPFSDGSHQLFYLAEVPQSGHGLSSLQYTVLSDHSVHVCKVEQK